MTETAPCPWCEDGGKPFLHLSREPFMSYTVKCHTCFATGPHVKFEPNQRRPWLETIAKPMVEATKLWNQINEKSGENREDDKPSDTALAATARHKTLPTDFERRGHASESSGRASSE
jgi:hypothetical protein